MFKTVGMIFTIVIIIVVLLLSAFGLTWLGIEWRGFFGPKSADVEREIFESTKSYNEGMHQELSRYRLQYMTANTQEEKDAIASTIRLRFATYDDEKMPAELKQFLQSILNPSDTLNFGDFNDEN